MRHFLLTETILEEYFVMLLIKYQTTKEKIQTVLLNVLFSNHKKASSAKEINFLYVLFDFTFLKRDQIMTNIQLEVTLFTIICCVEQS